MDKLNKYGRMSFKIKYIIMIVYDLLKLNEIL